MHSTTIAITATLIVVALLAYSVRAETAQPAPSDTAGPISAELAKKCRALATKAHPTERAGTTPYAQAQREYFQDCIAKRGNMPE
jgi:hypothetical protein